MIHIRVFRSFFFLAGLLFIFNTAYSQENTAEIQSLISQLASENPQSQITAAKELGRIGDKRATEPLIACLNNTNIRNPIVKTAVIEALGQIGDPQAVEPLITCIKSRDSILYRPAIEALGKIGDKRAVEPLSEFLIRDRIFFPDIEAALKVLGEFGDPNAVDEIDALLQSNYVFEPTKKLAIDTMIKLDKDNGMANLIKRWKNSDSMSRRSLSKNLVQAGKTAVGPLIDLLNELNIQPNASIRTNRQLRSNISQRDLYADTIEILGQIGDPASAEAIIMNLGASDFSVRNASKKALIKLNSAAVESLIQFLQTKKTKNKSIASSNMRDAAIEILGEIGDPNAVHILIQCLKTGDYSEVRAAAIALGKIGDPQAIPHLSRLLQDDNSIIIKAAAEALAKMNYNPESEKENIPFLIAQRNWSQLAQIGSPAVTALIECLNNIDDDIASEARDTLVKIGKPAVIPLIAYLKKDLKDQPQLRPRVNRNRRVLRNGRSLRLTYPTIPGSIFSKPYLAIEALGDIGDSRAVEPLLDYMENAGKSCSPSVAEALGKLGDKRAARPLIARLDQTEFGAASAVALTKILGGRSLDYVVPLLPQWGVNNEMIAAISNLGWKPRTETEQVYQWAARDDRSELLANWEQTKRILLSDLKEEYKIERTVDEFITLEIDDHAVISSLSGLLSRGDSTSGLVANLYLNCGHARLMDAAANWYVNKGFKVSYVFSVKDKNGNVTSSRSYDKETTPRDEWLKLLRDNQTWK